MTSENRDVWADVYASLIKDEINKKSLESIQESLFVLCIDDADGQHHKTSDTNERTRSALQLLHGNKEYSSNRWHDKTIQVCFRW